MYNVVSDIDRYKDFLPWCTDSKITSRKENVVTADLKIGFQIYEEKYTSKVELEKPRSVKVLFIYLIYFNSIKTYAGYFYWFIFVSLSC